jgi:hypothetical protein
MRSSPDGQSRLRRRINGDFLYIRGDRSRLHPILQKLKIPNFRRIKIEIDGIIISSWVKLLKRLEPERKNPLYSLVSFKGFPRARSLENR